MPRRVRGIFIGMRNVVKKLPRFTWMIIGFYLLLAGWYAVVTPLFEKPDEHWHFAFAMYLVETGQLPVQTVETRDHYAEQEGSQPPLYYATLAALLTLTGQTHLEPGFLTLTEENPYYGGRPGAWLDNANQFVHLPCQDEACQRTANAVYIGRGLSIFFGVIALLGAAVTLRLAFPENDALLLLSLALIAFTPQFLHITSSVSNDAVTVAMVNVAFALGVAWLKRPDGRLAVAAGVVVGLATLGKMSGLSIGVIIGGALLLLGQIGWRDRILHLVGYGIAFLAVTGWWFWRNIVLYGEPTATAIHLEVYGTPPAALTWNTLSAEWQAVINSFWASFGWGGINPPDSVYELVRWVLAFCFVLFGIAVIRRWRGWTTTQRIVTLLMIGQLLLVGLLHFRWMRLTIAPLGRLMFPAILPIAFMIALGVVRSGRWGTRVGAVMGSVWLAVAIIIPFWLIRPAYVAADTLPLLPTDATPIGATFGDSIVLEGYHIEKEGYQEFDIPDYLPGEVVPIMLYWRTTEPITEQLSVGLKFFDGEGVLMSDYNSYPDGGRAPITGWETGEVIVDRANLLISPDASMPRMAHLEIDLFDHETLTALPVTLNGETIRPFRPVNILVRDTEPPEIGEYIVGFYPPKVQQITIQATTVTMLFEWDMQLNPIEGNAQALFHLTAPDEPTPLKTADFTPLGGVFPAKYWQMTDDLSDQAMMELPTDVPPDRYVLRLGLYNPDTLERIPGMIKPTGTTDERGKPKWVETSDWIVATLEWDGTTWREIP